MKKKKCSESHEHTNIKRETSNFILLLVRNVKAERTGKKSLEEGKP